MVALSDDGHPSQPRLCKKPVRAGIRRHGAGAARSAAPAYRQWIFDVFLLKNASGGTQGQHFALLLRRAGGCRHGRAFCKAAAAKDARRRSGQPCVQAGFSAHGYFRDNHIDTRNPRSEAQYRESSFLFFFNFADKKFNHVRQVFLTPAKRRNGDRHGVDAV